MNADAGAGDTREAIGAARRVVVKVGSSSLTDPTGGLRVAQLDALVDALAETRRRGGEMVLVSSGAIASGLLPLGLARRPKDLATQQAAASVGQGLLLHRYSESFGRHGLVVGQVLLTADDVVRRAHYRNAQRTFYRLLALGVVPVVNENDAVATDEIRFGDNDRLAALIAHVVHADALVLLSDVDGLYDTRPSRSGARLVAQVAGASDLEGVRAAAAGSTVGTGGMASKVAAARIATGAGIPVVLAHADDAGAALAGGTVGTYFTPTRQRMPTRMLWLAHAADPRGSLTLDEGAVCAVTENRASLLPAGIVEVQGTFVAGDVVDVLNPQGEVVARGLVNFDAAELPDMLGRSTRELATALGSGYEREVIHRDDLVLIDQPSRTVTHRRRGNTLAR